MGEVGKTMTTRIASIIVALGAACSTAAPAWLNEPTCLDGVAAPSNIDPAEVSSIIGDIDIRIQEKIALPDILSGIEVSFVPDVRNTSTDPAPSQAAQEISGVKVADDASTTKALPVVRREVVPGSRLVPSVSFVTPFPTAWLPTTEFGTIAHGILQDIVEGQKEGRDVSEQIRLLNMLYTQDLNCVGF